ncbi:Type I restriction-modification system, specificity subunit S [Methanosarcina siciliae C2J]|uniref:Type I restriction-modification system, specificity subunit S n=1 Tax=Methanosarcina siciliae C2J TaxID=1434118 RepID=A0A0E3PM00_9EURY|nr:restriction endonuclease subunit S [Methanosarcina siciliae]AKB35932.1 Type I restriction-modification system, specificity subunit S [Methanosarcina siciliae C2J]
MENKNVEVPEGYKITELGIIPEEWSIGTLESIAEINPKTNTSSFEENTIVTFLPMQNVGENGKILKYETRKYSEVKKGYTCFAEKDVLFAKITPCMENGKGALATNLENKVGFGSTEYHVLRSKQNGSPEYTFYLTKWEKFRKEAEKYMTGSAGQRRVSKNVFFSYKIPIPPFPEQQKITSILSKVDEQIEHTERVIEKTEILKKGLMQKLLTKGIGHTKFKKTELGRIPEEWNVFKLSELLERKYILSHLDGNHGSKYPKAHEFVDSGVLYVSANAIIDGTVDISKAKYLALERAKQFTKGIAKSGDVLLAHNATVGPTALLETDQSYVILSTSLTYYRCNLQKVSNYFLKYYMESSLFQNQLGKIMKQTTRNQVPITMQRNLYFCLPSIEEQREIGNTLFCIEKQIMKNGDYLTRLQELKKGLMQDLLTGKVRVCV